MGEFGKLWGAGTISSVGDGVMLVAAPLLATTLTKDPVQVAGLMIAEQAPWVLLTLPGGALVDRLDRRLLMSVTSAIRVVALGVLGLAVLSGHVSLPLLYVAGVLAGCAGVLYENASMTLLPETAGDAPLERANGRMLATTTFGRALAAPTLGAWLFSLAAWTPFVLGAWSFVLVGVLCLALRVGRSRAPAERVSLRAAIGEGLRWLLRHRLLRTLAVTVALSNLGLGAVFSVLVLIAQQRLGLGSVGYGLFMTAAAVGGILGGLVADRVARAIGRGTALRAGLVLEALAHAGLALTRQAVLAAVVLGVLSLHLMVFSTINASLRQSLVPPELLGRVHSAYRLLSNGGMFLGAVLGGVLAGAFGLTAPFWVGATGLTVVTAWAWRELTNHRIREARSLLPAGSSPPRR